jgi:hypothetical protein
MDEKPHRKGSVTGHDFSRANKATEINRALAPVPSRTTSTNFVSNLRIADIEETPVV